MVYKQNELSNKKRKENTCTHFPENNNEQQLKIINNLTVVSSSENKIEDFQSPKNKKNKNELRILTLSCRHLSTTSSDRKSKRTIRRSASMRPRKKNVWFETIVRISRYSRKRHRKLHICQFFGKIESRCPLTSHYLSGEFKLYAPRVMCLPNSWPVTSNRATRAAFHGWSGQACGSSSESQYSCHQCIPRMFTIMMIS